MFFVRKKTKQYCKTGALSRLYACFLLSSLLSFCWSSGRAQEAKTILVTLTVQDKPLKDVFKDLEQKSGLSINYQDNVLDVSRKVSLSVHDRSLSSVLDQLLADTRASFIQKGTMILLIPRPAPTKVGPSGTLKGRIVDFETAQPLPGASVTIQETGYSVLSDERGFYVFNHLPDSTYMLVVTYTGYQKNYLPGVAVKAGKEKIVDVKMQAGSSLSEVVIYSGPRHLKAVTHSTEKSLLGEIRNATGVVSGISNEMITKTGDRNAAEVVKRISGVTVVDDRFIVIRGMNERYNLTYLNNNVAPSTELYSKAFAYDLLPSSIIDRILVYKSPVANLVADYGGGVIKVFTKNAMPVKHLDIGVQLAHRPGSTLATINSYNGGKYDFLGFDDGTRKLPGFSPGYFQTEKNANNLSQADMVSAFTNTLNYGTRHSMPDMQFFLNYYNSWKIGRRNRLYDLTSVTYTHETKNYSVYRQTGNTYAYGLDTLIGVNYGGLNKFINSVQSSETGKINLLENLNLKLGERNSIEFKNFFVNEGRNFTTVTDSRLNAAPHTDSSSQMFRTRDIILSFQQRMLYSGNIDGRHILGSKGKQELGWSIGYTYDLQNVPDQRGSHFASTYGGPYLASGSNYGGDYAFLGMISRLFVKNREQVYVGSIDYSLQLGNNLVLKAGTYQMYKLRDVGRRFFRVNRGGMAPDEVKYGDVPAGYQGGYGLSNPAIINFTQQQLGSIWSPANFPQDNSGLKLYDATNPTDSYVASEQNNSFYGMGDWKAAGGKLTLNAGVRVEYDRQKVASATLGAYDGSVMLVYANHPKTSVLPSINISYRPGQTVVLRTGYGRTVNRPEFREVSAFRDFDFQNIELVTGNPSLISATIDNYDFRAELYPRSAAQNETFNAGVFYKYMQDPIERLRTENTNSTGNSNFTEINFANAQSAKVYGVEAEVKKSLSFLGGSNLFRDLSLVANGTLIKSSTVASKSNGTMMVASKGRPLQGQSPYVVNTGLFYENAGWGSKIGIVYNVSGARIYAKSSINKLSSADDSLQYRPDLVQLPFHQLDLSVSQRIVKSLQMKFTIQNLLDRAARIIEDHNYNQRYDPEQPVVVPPSGTDGKGGTYYKGDNIYNSYKPGLYLVLQLTYAF